MRPTTVTVVTADNVFDFNALLHPGTVFERPKDVVVHPSLSLCEKRAILSSWASDASSFAACPTLRTSSGLQAEVTVDEILDALRELDSGPRHPPGSGKPNHPPGGRPNRLHSVSRVLAA